MVSVRAYKLFRNSSPVGQGVAHLVDDSEIFLERLRVPPLIVIRRLERVVEVVDVILAVHSDRSRCASLGDRR